MRAGTGSTGSRGRGAAMVVALVGTLLAGAAGAQQPAYTPAAGSPERRAIFDALRAAGQDRGRVYVPSHLKVADGWAWVVAEPRSRDGASRFEPERALVRREGARWSVVARPCGEEACDDARETARIRAAFPRAPAAIFPR